MVQGDLSMLRANFIISTLLLFLFFSFTLPVAADTGREELFRQVLAHRMETMPWVSMTPEMFAEIAVMGRKIAMIDVRSPMETAVWHPADTRVVSAFCIPLQQVANRLAEIHAEKFDFLVFTCPTGPRAAAAAVIARLMGFDNAFFYRGGNEALGGITGSLYRRTALRLMKQGRISSIPEWIPTD
jgi:rhodanese-related sulfurtransferase